MNKFEINAIYAILKLNGVNIAKRNIIPLECGHTYNVLDSALVADSKTGKEYFVKLSLKQG